MHSFCSLSNDKLGSLSALVLLKIGKNGTKLHKSCKIYIKRKEINLYYLRKLLLKILYYTLQW